MVFPVGCSTADILLLGRFRCSSALHYIDERFAQPRLTVRTSTPRQRLVWHRNVAILDIKPALLNIRPALNKEVRMTAMFQHVTEQRHAWTFNRTTRGDLKNSS
jgi:hypothetical protein